MARTKFKNKPCEKCSTLVRDRFCKKHFLAFRFENGLCVACGERNNNGKRKCNECLIKYNNYYKNRYNKEREHLRYLKRKKRLLQTNAIWHSFKYKTDIRYRLLNNVKNRFKSFIRNCKKNLKSSFSKTLGCDKETFFNHIESSFKDGMSWDNYSFNTWHIDHIVPLSLFDPTDELQLRLCNNYQNLQALSCEDNLKKNNKLELDETKAHIIWLDGVPYAIMED
jgi:hypothetical protein